MKRLLHYFDRHPVLAVILALVALGFCIVLTVPMKDQFGVVSLYR